MKQTMMPGLPSEDTGSSRRFLVLMALLLIIIGIGASMRLGGVTEPESIEIMDREGGEEDFVVDQTDWPIWNPATETWGAIDDHDVRTQALIPIDALNVACNKVEGFSWNILAHSGAFKRLNMASVFADSPKHRGAPIEVIGELLQLQKTDVFDRYKFKVDGRTQLWEGILKPRKDLTGSETPLLFLMVDEQEDNLAESLKVGDSVKLQGVFFKLQGFDLGGTNQVGPWVLGKRIMPNFCLPEPGDVRPKLIAAGVDDVERERGLEPFFQEGLFHLMVAALNRSGFLYEGVETIGGVKTRELLKMPDTHRGKTLSLSGRVIRFEEHKMRAFFPQNREGDHAIDRFWIAYVTADGTVPLSIMMLSPPPEDLTTKSVVDLEAAFFRVWGFRSQNGWSVSPLLVAVSDLRIRSPVEESIDYVSVGILVLGVLLAVVVIIVLYKDRRNAELQARSLRARRQLRQGRIDLNQLGEPARSESTTD